VLRNVNKVMIDKNSAGSGVVPYLPLPELKTTPPAPPASGPQPPRQASPAPGATR
jgi:modulator of FtsH protease HflK